MAIGSAFIIETGRAVQKFQSEIIRLRRPDIEITSEEFVNYMVAAIRRTMTLVAVTNLGIFDSAMAEVDEAIRLWDEAHSNV